MSSYGKLLSYFKQYLPAADGRYGLTAIGGTRIVAGAMVVSLLLPLPWFTLSDKGKTIAGTRLLSYAFEDFAFLFSISQAHTVLLFSLPIVITILAIMTLADTIINNAGKRKILSIINIVAMLLLTYAATVAADPARHIVIGGALVLPKWGLWVIFLLAAVNPFIPVSKPVIPVEEDQVPTPSEYS